MLFARILGCSYEIRTKIVNVLPLRCPNGRVEAVFEGPKDRVEEIVRWCHHGPPEAVVGRVEMMEEEHTGQYARFLIT